MSSLKEPIAQVIAERQRPEGEDWGGSRARITLVRAAELMASDRLESGGG